MPSRTPELQELEGGPRFRRLRSRALRVYQDTILIVTPLLAAVFIFDLPQAFGAAILREQYLGLFLILTLTSVFVLVPASRRAPPDRPTWCDAALAGLTVVAGGYLTLYYPRIVNEIGELTADKVLLGALAILLVMEASRRMTGWVLVIIAGVFILYAHYAYLFPGLLYARGISWSKIAVHLYIDPNSLLGIPLAIVATIVVAFIFFGQVLYASGGGDFFTNLATAVMGRFRGGAAKISVLASALFGTISGSPVANVVVDGAITIPMMVRSGYRPHVAAAVESVASTGGQLMPPVMGAAAFVMAEFLGVSYAKVALAAAVPALLYYLALFVQVDLEAGKTGIRRVPKDLMPSVLPVLREGWIFILPMALIIYILFVMNLAASKAGFYAGAVAIAVTLVNPKSRITLSKLPGILRGTGLALLEVSVVCAVAGIVIGILTLTGLASVFTLFVERFGSENVFLTLVLTALIALVLGMGMPTTAVYVVVALTLAPALTKLGLPPMAAHLFVFYYAMLSMITPPICIAAFAGAAIAGTSPMRTGYACMRLAIVAYVVPFIFVFDPLLLLQGGALLVTLAAVTAALGTVAIGAAMVGYFVRPLGWIKRAVLALAAVGLFIPPGGAITGSVLSNIAGGAVSIFILGLDLRARRGEAAAGEAIGTAR